MPSIRDTYPRLCLTEREEREARTAAEREARASLSLSELPTDRPKAKDFDRAIEAKAKKIRELIEENLINGRDKFDGFHSIFLHQD